MEFKVPEMSCGHCTSSIEKAVKGSDETATLACDLEARTVSVQSSLPVETVAGLIKGAGYDNEVIAA
ncbi:MAG: heavy metal-binding protein [Thalassobium sp.]|uniref:heavy-metal-associated domain-containing protein n=1 Tax=Octadecabacter sp. SW4 TaxID=2602067 RepID=UPI000C10CA3B|nr:heavy-metal-associated domain-containing protein [Octadecabacter sp. SW4]PHQ81643.1 MAG: heavy metal-binding protein [Thalassobium sp.]QEE34628.1 heavy-metal-associated domain-containing protein [Octadecabacter sp. SW4]|tara:strand:+ start:1003 stop:1203 length:201 start_codon:yes stop_codon:yes gene_type:complete